ncbi:hypothetical protein FRB95_009172 [Tulasnella sp. JGI-2019a]|nr:hypothetical protein FRB95_009172 [Tulasnella sp. JGI-2019a]
MAAVKVIRTFIFASIAILSLIVLGLLGHLTALTNAVGFYYSSFALGMGTAVLSLLFVLVGAIIDTFRRGAITSLVWFELACTGLLWVLWLATATSIQSLGIFRSCDYVNAGVESSCHEFQTVEAFSWLLWIFSLY